MATAVRSPSTRTLLLRGVWLTLVILGVLAFFWIAGLVWFGATMPTRVENPTTRTDAIVVLTGGSRRLAAGMALLRQGRARMLFLSGVNRQVSKADILRRAGGVDGDLAKRIFLGYRAEHTRGNAAETALWATAQQLRSIRLVTANYHMRRSLLELRQVLPNTGIVPHPVFPRDLEPGRWWRTRTGISTVVGEYNKYLAAQFRLTFPALFDEDGARWS